jgi:hypothetical protein
MLGLTRLVYLLEGVHPKTSHSNSISSLELIRVAGEECPKERSAGFETDRCCFTCLPMFDSRVCPLESEWWRRTRYRTKGQGLSPVLVTIPLPLMLPQEVSGPVKLIVADSLLHEVDN